MNKVSSRLKIVVVGSDSSDSRCESHDEEEARRQ